MNRLSNVQKLLINTFIAFISFTAIAISIWIFFNVINTLYESSLIKQ